MLISDNSNVIFSAAEKDAAVSFEKNMNNWNNQFSKLTTYEPL